MGIEDFADAALRQGVEQQSRQSQIEGELAKHLHVGFGEHPLAGEHIAQRNGQINRAGDAQNVEGGIHACTAWMRSPMESLAFHCPANAERSSADTGNGG